AILTERSVYHSDHYDMDFIGVDQIISRFRHVYLNHNGQYKAYMARITGNHGADLECSTGTRCLALYGNEEGCESLVFVKSDSEGFISHITVSTDLRYEFCIEDAADYN
ncbi:MAG: hypothetical protein IJK25_02150, partial [Firmicutes bacterium]|nr:hypothetical protein [Bacillota bacterium]